MEGKITVTYRGHQRTFRAKRGLYFATPAVTRDFGFHGIIKSIASFIRFVQYVRHTEDLFFPGFPTKAMQLKANLTA